MTETDPALPTSTVTIPTPTPTPEDQQDILLSSRYGELDEVKRFVETFGIGAIAGVCDEHGNTVLHMVCANGHEDILSYLLTYTYNNTTTTTTQLPPNLLSQPNHALSTPLHWAALNAHLPLAKMLVEWPLGPGVQLIEMKNRAGRTPAGEAEASGWEEGAMWFASVRRVEEKGEGEGKMAGREVGDEVGEKEKDERKGEVEVHDVEGRMRDMSLSSKGMDNANAEQSSQ